MFECTQRQPASFSKVAVVAVLAGAMLAVQALVFVQLVGLPLADAFAGIRTLPAREPTRDDLPVFEERIIVTAPYRARHATAPARGTPLRHPDPVWLAAMNGYCFAER